MSTTEGVEEAAVPAGAETTGPAGAEAAVPAGAEARGPAGAEAVGLKFDDEVRLAQERLRSESNQLAAAATALGPLARAATYGDLKKLRTTVEKVEEKLPAEVRQEAGLADLLGRLQVWVDEAGERLRRRLGRELRAACASAGLEFRVVSRESPLELRIPPFAVVLDFEKGQAVLKFARLEVMRTAAEAEAILAAHTRARR